MNYRQAKSMLDAGVKVKSNSVTYCYHPIDGTVKPDRHGGMKPPYYAVLHPINLGAMHYG